MAIYYLTFTNGQKALSTDMQKLADNSVNDEDDIHPQYLQKGIYTRTAYTIGTSQNYSSYRTGYLSVYSNDSPPAMLYQIGSLSRISYDSDKKTRAGHWVGNIRSSVDYNNMQVKFTWIHKNQDDSSYEFYARLRAIIVDNVTGQVYTDIIEKTGGFGGAQEPPLSNVWRDHTMNISIPEEIRNYSCQFYIEVENTDAYGSAILTVKNLSFELTQGT